MILLSGWCWLRMRSFATDVKSFFVHYYTSTYTYTRQRKIISSYSVIYIYSSLSLSISPPNSVVVFVTLTQVKALLAWSSCLWFTIIQRPTVFVTSRAKLYGGTVHVTKLEKVELIDGDIHQECSLDRQLKNLT